MTPELHGWLVRLMFLFAAFTFVALCFVTAPYGRHTRRGWGPTIPARAGWIIMELPACLGFLWIYLQGEHRFEPVPLLLLGLWQWHYVQRTFVFPFRIHTAGKRMPLVIPLMGIAFNLLNVSVNATWISQLGSYPRDGSADARLWIGASIFFVGWIVNLRSDNILIALRKPGDSGYKIPRGGLYRWVSSPNYLGEIVEWTGWAVASWSLGGLAFAVYTFANLAPRAWSTHRWYRETFPDYPKKRRALIPFVV